MTTGGGAAMGMGPMEVAIIVAVLAIVVVALLPGGRTGTQSIADETIVPGVDWTTADQVLFRELGSVRGLALVEAHAGSFMLRRTSRAPWAIAGAIVLFPWGLLFLLLTQEQHVHVSVTEHPRGCRLRVVGRARAGDARRVGEALHRVLPVQVDVPR